MQNLGRSMVCFGLCYVIVTLVGILHTVFNGKVLHMKTIKDSPGMGEAYEKTKPWHALYNIILFSIFGMIYLKGIAAPSLNEALATSGLWLGICVIFDLFGWVLIKHPWSLTFKEFYIEYQPWITLIYCAIFLGPLAGFWLINVL